MKLLADENFEPEFVEKLRAAGHEVIFLDEYDAGISDHEVLRRAVRENAVVITNDKDFGEMVVRHGFESRGVIFLRLYELPLSERIEIVLNVISSRGEELESAFTTISREAVRVRKSF
ncbi:MAG: DUF5615 family PIN-like protein [Chloracidobacterium sp.]|nr:DUF5615 family PIN-like protein [Chloracidobacterium sp.]